MEKVESKKKLPENYINKRKQTEDSSLLDDNFSS